MIPPFSVRLGINTPARAAKIKALYLEGMGKKRIARHLDCGVSTVQRVVGEMQ